MHITSFRNSPEIYSAKWMLHYVTPVPVAEAPNGIFRATYNRLIYIKIRNTGSGHIEIHESPYEHGVFQPLQHWATFISAADAANGVFDTFNEDLYFIKTRNTTTGNVEIHCASKKSGYQPSLQTITGFSCQDADNGIWGVTPPFTWRAAYNDPPDLYFIKTRNTGAKFVEFHLATSNSGYRQFGLHNVSSFPLDCVNTGSFLFGDGNSVEVPSLIWCRTQQARTQWVEMHAAPATHTPPFTEWPLKPTTDHEFILDPYVPGPWTGPQRFGFDLEGFACTDIANNGYLLAKGDINFVNEDNETYGKQAPNIPVIGDLGGSGGGDEEP